MAQAKRVSLIFLSSMEVLGHDWRGVNQSVLKNASCSVAVFVDRGFRLGSESDHASTSSAITDNNNNIPKTKVCVLFWGGPDDRQALELGKRMAQHADVMVTVLRLLCGCYAHDHKSYCCSNYAINYELEKVINH